MSTRPQLSPFPVIVDGDMSADITSEPTVIQKISMLSYQYTWAGSSPLGTVSVQVSNDFSLEADGTVRNAGTWDTLVLNVGGSAVTTVAVSGNTGSGFVDIDQLGAYAIRTIFTVNADTPGTGLLQCFLNGKVA